MLHKYLNTLMKGTHLSQQEALELSTALASPGHSPAVVGAILSVLRAKGETADEISGFVLGLKKHAVAIPVSKEAIYDVAGTGGDGAHTQNISTLTALILAGAGLAVAKHGNRSVSSSCGSADVLHASGVNINATAANIARQLASDNLCFIYAPLAHPSMKNVMEVRKSLRMPSIYNLAGPLSNPLSLTGQIVGVYSPALLDTMTQALLRLGMERGAVIHGHGGLDEASLSGPNAVRFIENGCTSAAEIRSKELGLSEASVTCLRGGAPADNAKALLQVLQGQQGPFRDAGLLNSAIALYGFGKGDSLTGALQIARDSLDGGKALRCLERLVATSNEQEVQ